ncbi:MAG: hypothetical protein AAGD86_03520 [Pseudomonadota bacterium]
MGESIREQIRRNTVALISLAVAITSLSYATWRNEVTEDNRNVRVAGFAVIERLASLDEVTLFARFSGKDATPAMLEMGRKEGWVHVIALRDLCYTMPEPVQRSADDLHAAWQEHSEALRSADGYAAVNAAIEEVRSNTIASLRALD